MYECSAYMHVCVLCAYLVSVEDRRALDPLGLELQMVVSCHVTVGSGEMPLMQVPRELELQVVVSHLIWVLGTKLGFSVKIECILNP